jgi:amino acid adenylation domain-containing protein
VSIARVDRTKPVAASFAQARLWFLDQLERGSATYNVPIVLRLSGAIDAGVLARAVQALVERHETLRTTFVAIEGEPYQVIHPSVDVRLGRVAAASEDEAREIVAREVHAPFDLARGPLLRATLVRLGADAHVLALCIHHIATDGWSSGILLRELSALYGAFSEGKGSPLLAPAIDYADFAVWQRAWLTGDVLAEQLAFWKQHLAGAPAALELPTDRPRPASRQHHGDTIDFALPADVAEAVRALCRREGATPFMVFLAAYQAVLSRWSGQHDIVVGTAIANRTSQAIEPLVGFFVNTLAMRTHIAGDASFVDVVRLVKQSSLSAYAHQDVPFEKLVEELKVPRDMSRTPIFQAFFVMQNAEIAPVALTGLTVSEESTALAVAKFDISLGLEEAGGSFRGSLDFDTALFDRATMERFVEHLGVFLDAATRTSGELVAKLPLMTAAEKQRVLAEWNATAHAVGEVRTVHGMIEAQTARTPEAVAVEFEGRRLTYRELDARANRVAHWLLARGVALEERVAVELERSEDMLSAVLGVMKAGCAYVPIDAKLPDDRKRFMKEDAGVKLVLDDLTIVEALSHADVSRPAIEVRPEHLAYVLYTSGSTGRPKGVMVEHGSVANLLVSLAYEPGVSRDETMLSLTTLSFDVSVAELFLPLAYGAKVVVGSREASRDPKLIAKIIEATGARTFGATPTTWRMMVDSGWRPSAGMEIHVAGEALPRDLADALVERGATLWNLYGPTETTVYASGVEVVPGRITIGRPLRNTQFYVVDALMQPVPIGVPGELCIAGDGVARGYLGRPELTAEKFVEDPFAGRRGARMYRTGDLARWLPNGEVDYLGRLDHQVKIRGFRIELGEIEAVLSAIAGVRESVVLAREDVPGDKRLVAYVVAAAGATLDVEALRTEVGRLLPEYMVPSAFVVLGAMPMTTTGKVDRNALPKPDFAAAASEYVAPRDAVEQSVADVFQQVLRLEKVGVHDDFFALGGHSLLAMQVVSRLQAAMGIELPVRAVFECPTVAMLAARVRAAAASTSRAPEIARVSRDKPLPASFAQARLWFLEQLQSGGATYNVPLVLRLEGALDEAILERALSALVERHETLRTTFVALEGEPHQVVHPPSAVKMSRVEASSAEAAREAVSREAHAPFDLATGPLLRATLVRLRADAHVLVVCIHHIATDGWSSGILLRELSALYGAFVAGQSSPLSAPAIDYADFAVWQRAWLTGDVLAEQLAFWKEHLAGAPAALELPTDRPRPAVKQHHGDTIDFALPAEVAEGVRALCRREGATPFMVFLAAYQAVLSRWSGQRDIVVGTAIANRTSPAIEPLVGFFVNTLTMRTQIGAESSFTELVRSVKQSSLSAYAHQDVPFEKLVEELKVARDMSRTPIFQAFFVMQNAENVARDLANVSVREQSAGLEVEKFDVSLGMQEEGGTFHGGLGFDTTLFDRATMTRFVEHLGVFIAAATRTPGERIAKLPLMTEAERRRVIVEWNATAHPLGEVRTVHGIVAAQAGRTPDAVAVEFEGRKLTYRALDERSTRVAQWLLASGVTREERVAVEVERSEDMLSAVLGVMKAGCAYVPVDAKLPDDRKQFMKEDAGVKIVLDDVRLAEALSSRGALPLPEVAPGQLAYVLYTSGSTGRPKGVMVEHGSVANLLVSLAYEPGVDSDETMLSLTTLSFDVSVAELFLPLAYGAKVVIGSREASRDPKLIASIIEATGARTFGATPTTWRMMVDSGWRPSAEMEIHVAGEALPRDLADALVERGATLWNLYGPTETTVYASGVEVRPGRITIGRPLRNTQLYVVDALMQPVPIGVPGELCIGGDGVARGYLGRPELTADKFVRDPFASRPGALMYRTGDLARWLPTGEVDYLGRLDHQVKIRGFRIELGEIESVLSASTGVRESVVLAREDVPGDKRLVAYVVAAAGTTLDVDVLRTELARKLPEYMVPSAFVMLDTMPMTTTGKVDRNALPKPDFSAAAVEYVAPRGELEETLADIFRQVLRVERVGAHDDFFALGGHSLLVTQVVSRIRTHLGIDVPVRVLFEASTVARLAAYISSGAGEDPAPPIVPTATAGGSVLSYWQESILAWERRRKRSYQWNRSVRLRLDGVLDESLLVAAIRALLTRQEALRLIVQIDPAVPPILLDVERLEVPALDMSGASDAEVDKLVGGQASEPFALDGSPLIRFMLLRRSASENLLVIHWHQILHDATDVDLIVHELLESYAALVERRAPQLPPLPFRYVDYAAWERGWFDSGASGQVESARARLAGAPPMMLPTDRQRTGDPTTEAVSTYFELDAAMSDRFSKLCHSAQVTFFMGAVAVVGIMLGQLCESNDIIMLSPISTRTRDVLKPLAGRFGNWIPLRVSLDGNPSVREVFERARRNATSAYAHAAVPASKVYGGSDVFSHPLGRVVLNMPELDGSSEKKLLEYGGLTAVPAAIGKPLRAVSDLVLVLVRRDKRMFVTFGGAADLYDEATILRMAAQLKHLFETIELDARVPLPR